MADTTEWFDGDTKPARVGVYERDIRGLSSSRFAYWNGEYWCAFAGSPDGAMEQVHISSTRQNAPWRGLTKKAGKVVNNG